MRKSDNEFRISCAAASESSRIIIIRPRQWLCGKFYPNSSADYACNSTPFRHCRYIGQTSSTILGRCELAGAWQAGSGTYRAMMTSSDEVS